MAFSSCIIKSCVIGTFVLVVLCFLVGIPTIIIYSSIVDKYKSPTFTLDQASITGFNLTSDGHLTAFFDVVIRANNLNHKRKLSYGNVRVSIFKDKQNLAEDALPGFTQHKGNVTFLRAQPVAINIGLKKGPVFDFGVESGMGYLDFDVFMTSGINGDNLEVNCRHVKVNVTASSVGFVANPPPSVNDNNSTKFESVGCSVYIYSNDNGP